MVGFQCGAFERSKGLCQIGPVLLQNRVVFSGVGRCQGQPANLGEQPAYEEFVGCGHAHMLPQGLHGQSHQQGMRPVGLIFETGAGAGAVLVEQRKPQRQLPHRRHALADHGFLQ